MKTLQVKFLEHHRFNDGEKTFDYLFDGADEVKANMHAVVSVNGLYRVVKIMTVVDGWTEKATKPIVCLVDDAGYKARVEAAKERQNIIKELTEIDKKMSAKAKFEHLRVKDERAAELLDRLSKMGDASLQDGDLKA